MGTERIAVIGAGLMGHGLAQVFAEAGHPVAITDPDPETLASAPARVAANLQALGRDPEAAEAISLHADAASAVADAQFVFEAAPERPELKQQIFAALERDAPTDAILATNTSVIPVAVVAEQVTSAARVVGTHWWNPPYLVPIVEVIQGDRTDDGTIARTMDLLRRAGKDPVHVKRDVPGFVGNRLQHALWREAISLVANGVCDADTVDRVVKGSFGRRLSVMGPLETAEYVGLDLTLDIHEQVLPAIDHTPGPSPYLRELVERGELGMKTGRGFREWSEDAAPRAREELMRHLSAPIEVGA